MEIRSSVENYGGVPTLFVNGEPQVGMAYITYFEENNCYQDFADAGYDLYSFACFFGDQTINEISCPAPFAPAIFAPKGAEDYSSFDKVVSDILAVCPKARIFPRVNMSLPRWWEEENPEELNDHGTYNHPEKCRVCYASKKWRAETERYIRKLIAHVESSTYREHIMGYQIASGGTEEWFSLDLQGGIGEASRREFQARGGDLQNTAAFRQFLSDIVAEDIVYIAGVVKEATQRRLVVGSFYGYTLECPFWTAPHHALKKLLRSADIDFLCSPASYRNTRQPGEDWGCITVLDSLLLHGKAYFAELDLRTHLTKYMKDSRANSCPAGMYEQPIWLGPKDPEVTGWILSANAGRQLTHGYNSWWFDMWGGWFASPEIMAEMKELRNLASWCLNQKHRGSIAEVAVFADECAYALVTDDGKAAGVLCYQARKPLGLAGAPYDIYDVADFEAVASRYQLRIFLVAYLTEGFQEAIAYCKKEGLPYLVFDNPLEPPTTERLRNAYLSNGVHIWCDTDDVLYANGQLLVIHAASAGSKHIVFPKTCKVQAMLPEGESFEAQELNLTLRQYETRIFRFL